MDGDGVEDDGDDDGFRWAQFFICPLMIKDAIEREVEAVDSGECLYSLYSFLILSRLSD